MNEKEEEGVLKEGVGGQGGVVIVVAVWSLINHPVFIGSRFPAVQFWFPVEYPSGDCYYSDCDRSMRRRRRCLVQMTTTTTGPFVRSANVIYHESRGDGMARGGGVVAKAAAPTHREPTQTQYVIRNVFFTVEKNWLKTSRVGGGKSDLKCSR